VCAAVVLIILGAHGFYVYFHRLEVLFLGGADELFLSIGVPSWLASVVEWASLKGFMSWTTPLLLVVGGLIAGLFSWLIKKGSKRAGVVF
jgi:hypothetical protein